MNKNGNWITGKRSDGEKNNVTHVRHRSTAHLTLFVQTNQLRCHYITTTRIQASSVNLVQTDQVITSTLHIMVSNRLLYSLEYTCNIGGEGES